MNRALQTSVGFLLMVLSANVPCDGNVAIGDSVSEGTYEFFPMLSISSEEEYAALSIGKVCPKTRQFNDRRIAIVDLDGGDDIILLPNPFAIALAWRSDVQSDILGFVQKGGEASGQLWPQDVLQNYSTDRGQVISEEATILPAEWVVSWMQWNPDGRVLAMAVNILPDVSDPNWIDKHPLGCRLVLSFDMGKTFTVTKEFIESRFWWSDPDTLVVRSGNEIRMVSVSHSNAHTSREYFRGEDVGLFGCFNRNPVFCVGDDMFVGNIAAYHGRTGISSVKTDGRNCLALMDGSEVIVFDSELKPVTVKYAPHMRLVGVSWKRRSIYLLNKTRAVLYQYSIHGTGRRELVSVAEVLAKVKQENN